MKTLIMTLGSIVTCFAPNLRAATQAQENSSFIYATYFHCNSGMVERADDAVTTLFASELNGMIKAGTASSWGWLRKNTGGEWARAEYVTAPSLKAVLNAVQELQVRSDAKPPVKAFEEACSSSEDYVWRVVAGGDARGHRGLVTFSTYYACDQSREMQADALVKRVVGPIYDKLVTDGKLTSWFWAEHIVGGKYRRLATLTAQSRDALIAVREELGAAAEHEPLVEAMTSICESHQDYIWEVKDQGP
jgi:hypothetical protein